MTRVKFSSLSVFSSTVDAGLVKNRSQGKKINNNSTWDVNVPRWFFFFLICNGKIMLGGE